MVTGDLSSNFDFKLIESGRRSFFRKWVRQLLQNIWISLLNVFETFFYISLNWLKQLWNYLWVNFGTLIVFYTDVVIHVSKQNISRTLLKLCWLTDNLLGFDVVFSICELILKWILKNIKRNWQKSMYEILFYKN